MGKDANQILLLKELDLINSEYSELRKELLGWISAQRQFLNYILIAFIAGFGAVPFILENNLYFILLIFPLFFYQQEQIIWPKKQAISLVRII